MNKKLILFLTLLMVFGLSAPVMAQSFQDVPENHWAYDSLRQVAQAGLINGYEDGTFRGNEALNRYEMATLTSNVLNKMETENEELNQEVVESVEALVAEFDSELDKLDNRLEDMETVKITGETGVVYEVTTVDGEAVITNEDGEEEVLEDPYSDDDDMITAEDSFKHLIQTNLNIAKEGVEAELELDAVNNYFGSEADTQELTVDSLSGRVITDKFAAELGNEQDLDWKDYLYAEEDNIDGVVLTSGGATVGLGRRADEASEEDITSLAARQDDVFDLPVDVFMGIEDGDERTTVIGTEGAMELAGLNITGEAAVNGTDFAGQLFRVGVDRDIDKLNLGVEYQNTDEFSAIQPDDFKDGEDTTLMLSVDEEDPYKLYGMNVFGNYEYGLNSEDEIRELEANTEVGDVQLAALYDFEQKAGEVDKEDRVVSVAYTPEFEVADVQIAPEAKLAAIVDKDGEQLTNQELAVGALYELNENVELAGNYSWADKEGRVEQAGRKMTADAGINYQVTESSSASLSYSQVDFEGAEEADSYETSSLVGKYDLKF